LNPEIPNGLDALIMRCLRKDPAQRPADIAELAPLLAAYGSANAEAYAASALRVLNNGRTNPALDDAPVSERTPTALSATLAVLGKALYARRARHVPRVKLVAAGLALATVLGGALTLRAGQAHEASSHAVLLPVSTPTALAAPQSEPATCPMPSTVTAQVAPLSSAAPVRTVSTKRAPKSSGRNAWDPKSFGGRL
jgi:hypothetical protein